MVNKPRPLLATMATSCPACTIATRTYVQEVGVAICAVHVWVDLNKRLREPTLCDQSCYKHASRIWRFCWTRRGWDHSVKCWILWKSTGSRAWHKWSRDTQGLSDRRPMQATKQADMYTLALHYNPPPPSTHSNTDHNLQVTFVSQLAISNHPALLRFDFSLQEILFL